MKRFVLFTLFVLCVTLTASASAQGSGPPLPYSVVATWVAPTGGAVPTGYNLYRAPYANAACGTYAALNATPITVLTYTDTTVVAGAQYCYAVTSISNGQESGPDVCASNPISIPPAPPTGLTVKVQ